jgi:hypothetical protein
MTLMTPTQWAIICTLHQEPNYRFVSNERQSAERMEKKGWLKSRGNNMFSITRSGEGAYRRCNSHNAVPPFRLHPRPEPCILLCE